MHRKILISILVIGALLRGLGLHFGLPLWVVGDEASLIFGALKMLELKTLLPILHLADFSNILYYTPYLPYSYLPTFAGFIGFKWLSFTGDMPQFGAMLKSDVSGFFLVARFYSVFFGTATIWLVYKSAVNMFKKESVGLAAALCFALAFLPVSYGHWARHWSAVTMIFALIIYFLSIVEWSISKRYLAISLTAAIGVGVNLQVCFALVFTALWLFCIDKLSLREVLKAKWFWQATIVFLTGSIIAYLIWPPGFAFLNLVTKVDSGGTTQAAKSLTGLLGSFKFYMANLLRAEPILLGLIMLGTVGMWFKYRALISSIWSFVLFYIAIFYLVFNTMDRFVLVLYPLFTIVAGYGLYLVSDYFSNQKKKFSQIAVGLITLSLLVPDIRFDYLLIKNDTRIQATRWLTHLPADTQVAVLAPLMRLSATTAATQKLIEIDPSALRTVDKAEMDLPLNLRKAPVFNALNLYTVKPELLIDLPLLLKKNQIEYLVTNKSFAKKYGLTNISDDLGEIVKIIPGSVNSISEDVSTGHQTIPDGYGDGLPELFRSKSFGPEIVIVKLKQS